MGHRRAGLHRHQLHPGLGARLGTRARHAEVLTRVGRWGEADTVLARLAGVPVVPPTAVRSGLAAAVLAARRGDLRTARARLDEAAVLPVDPWHQGHVQAVSADVRLAAGEWEAAMVEAGALWESECGEDRRWPAWCAAVIAAAGVERALDALARREPVDVAAVAAELGRRLDGARAACSGDDERPLLSKAAAQLASTEAQLTRLTGPDPDAWSAAAGLWERLGDPWATAGARLREADAAVATGSPARAADALRAAYATAVELSAAPLLAEAEAVSRRTRLSVEAPSGPVLERAEADRLGLTPREAEVLSLVAAGRTNRQIGEALYVSETTASVHVSNVLRKLGVTSRVEAAAVAQRVGIA